LPESDKNRDLLREAAEEVLAEWDAEQQRSQQENSTWREDTGGIALLRAALRAEGQVTALRQQPVERQPAQPMLLVWGTPADGFTFMGPMIPNDPAMEAWIERELNNEYWWYVPLKPPAWTTADEGDYLVTWKIDVASRDPREAAEYARECMVDSETTATVFEVTDSTGVTTVVDLGESV